jgi:hypothetical protein
MGCSSIRGSGTAVILKRDTKSMNIIVTGQSHVPSSSAYDFLYVISIFVFYIFILNL